jgi:molybdopterin-guanine dinucleotide biosynthesis protein A
MSGLKTWTVRCANCAIVVTANDVDLAISNIRKQFGITVQRSELIPLPTHHRYARMLTPIGETVRTDGNAAIVAELERLNAVMVERSELSDTELGQMFASGVASGLFAAIQVVQAGGALPPEGQEEGK